METRKIDVSRPSTVRRLERLLEELEEVSNLMRDAENGKVKALAVERLEKPHAVVEADVSRENTFSGLQKRLGWSSRTLAKYLKFCESNAWVYGYRDGGCVRFFITAAGLDFLYRGLIIGSLHDLARFVLSFPQARFYGWPKPVDSDSPAATLVVEARRYLLYGSEDVSGLEGRVIDLFTRLLRGLGLRLFTLAELEAKLGRPLTPEDIEKLNMRLKPRPRQPVAKIMPLLNWAALMNRNLHANNELYLRYVRGRPTDFAIV